MKVLSAETYDLYCVMFSVETIAARINSINFIFGGEGVLFYNTRTLPCVFSHLCVAFVVKQNLCRMLLYFLLESFNVSMTIYFHYV